MAKTTIKFSAVPYELGENSGYRPQLESQAAVSDLDFCTEVVNTKRLSMSPEELLHALEMVGECGPAFVAKDGRPRVITKLLKYNRYAKGKLDSPSSPWNDSCKAYIKAQLQSEAVKELDASFVNVNSADSVKLNYISYPGAQAVINVIKDGKKIIAYGNHMEFIEGDSAMIHTATNSYVLSCTSSDVAHAEFNWPPPLTGIEPGTEVTFEMTTRGGIPEGATFTSRKKVVVLAPDEEILPTVMSLTTDVDRTVNYVKGDATRLYVKGKGLDMSDFGNTCTPKLYNTVTTTWVNSTNFTLNRAASTPELVVIDFSGPIKEENTVKIKVSGSVGSNAYDSAEVVFA